MPAPRMPRVVGYHVTPLLPASRARTLISAPPVGPQDARHISGARERRLLPAQPGQQPPAHCRLRLQRLLPLCHRARARRPCCVWQHAVFSVVLLYMHGQQRAQPASLEALLRCLQELAQEATSAGGRMGCLGNPCLHRMSQWATSGTCVTACCTCALCAAGLGHVPEQAPGSRGACGRARGLRRSRLRLRLPRHPRLRPAQEAGARRAPGTTDSTCSQVPSRSHWVVMWPGALCFCSLRSRARAGAQS